MPTVADGRLLARHLGLKPSVLKGIGALEAARNAIESMSERVYLDWNATAPVRPEARAAMVAALDACGNPSSVHAEGRAARRLIETAREQVAALVGANPRNVVFTSGGTEANVLALSPAIGTGREPAPRGPTFHSTCPSGADSP